MHSLGTPLNIGQVTIRNRVTLAPMSGVTDLPFRRLAHEFGAGMVVTEMIASRELVGNRDESWSRLQNSGIRPHIVQLAGRDPRFMAEGARIAEANGADMIDINLGCPAKKVVGGLSGSALMREPELALALIEATVEAVQVPVSVKMRLGWDAQSMNAPDIACRAEQIGARLITVHGRTRMQFYTGTADWSLIRNVRERISVPLIVNGDIETPAQIESALALSGADAVMIGRGCQGRPWHAGVLAGMCGEPGREEQIDVFERHYRMMIEFYGLRSGLRQARKHVGWYLDRLAPSIEILQRSAIMTCEDPEDVIAMAREHMSLESPEKSMSEAA